MDWNDFIVNHIGVANYLRLRSMMERVRSFAGSAAMFPVRVLTDVDLAAKVAIRVAFIAVLMAALMYVI